MVIFIGFIRQFLPILGCTCCLFDLPSIDIVVYHIRYSFESMERASGESIKISIYWLCTDIFYIYRFCTFLVSFNAYFRNRPLSIPLRLKLRKPNKSDRYFTLREGIFLLSKFTITLSSIVQNPASTCST